MKHKATTVHNVLPGSIAEEAGIEPGDSIMSINGERVNDVFDYRFSATAESLLVEINKASGEIWEVEVEKDEYEDLGIEFINPMMDEAKKCSNKCIFCFIDQLPKGLRETLYFKDDDTRLSFLTGNYVTLTNMTDADVDRIIKYKMSPINVSVHTTNPGLRVFMLNNRCAGDALRMVERLANAGIAVNCQIVLCRGINDGNELNRTISDLVHLYPGIKSISIVPVGITKYREGLFDLKPYDRASANVVVSQVTGWQEVFVEKYAARIVYIADELYITAGLTIPDYETYEDFPQIENGVGLIALLKHDFFECLNEMDHVIIQGCLRNVSIATGVSAYSYIRELACLLEKKYCGLKVNVYEIENRFFGENVTVTGLLTGIDLASQLEGKDLGDVLLISRSMMKADEDLFLDDYTVGMLESRLGIRIGVVGNSGRDFIEKILGISDDNI